jgi:hypothetical protein
VPGNDWLRDPLQPGISAAIPRREERRRREEGKKGATVHKM